MPEPYRFCKGSLLKVVNNEDGTRSLSLQAGKEFLSIELPSDETLKFIEYMLPDYVETIGTTKIELNLINPCNRTCAYHPKKDHKQVEIAAHILTAVVNQTGVPVDKMKSKKKPPEIARARSLFFYLARKHTNLSYPFIGYLLGKNHTTVILAVKNIIERRITKPEIDRMVREIESQIENPRKESNHGK